ncbi:MAG TPA: hypothetical protein VGJ18_07445 [Gemmatimonadaceae bacterium]|jgi:hypothetical protein
MILSRNRLLKKLIGAPGATLRRVSEDTFSPDGIAPMIAFERNAKGRVVGYVQQAPDGSIARARRAMPWTAGEHPSAIVSGHETEPRSIVTSKACVSQI